MCRHVHLLLSRFLFLLCCLAVRPIEFKSCLLFWAFTLHSRIDHYFTAWVLLIITVRHSSEIQSITETYDHFITGTLFFSCSWSQRQKYAWRMKNAVCLLRIAKRLDQIQNRLSRTESAADAQSVLCGSASERSDVSLSPLRAGVCSSD